jgi:hypothetical protein
MVSGHDWRTAIGPRNGYFERCRRCYSSRTLVEQPAPLAHGNGVRHTVRTSSERAA